MADIKVTPAMIRRLKKLEERPESEIDYSDIPELTEKFWQNAVQGLFYRPMKTKPRTRHAR